MNRIECFVSGDMRCPACDAPVVLMNADQPYPRNEWALCHPCRTAYPLRLVLPTELQVDWFTEMFRAAPPPREPVVVPDRLLPAYLPSGTKWDAWGFFQSIKHSL